MKPLGRKKPHDDDIAENMRAQILAKRGEQMPNVVVIQGDANETLFSGRLMRLGSSARHCSTNRELVAA